MHNLRSVFIVVAVSLHSAGLAFNFLSSGLAFKVLFLLLLLLLVVTVVVVAAVVCMCVEF